MMMENIMRLQKWSYLAALVLFAGACSSDPSGGAPCDDDDDCFLGEWCVASQCSTTPPDDDVGVDADEPLNDVSDGPEDVEGSTDTGEDLDTGGADAEADTGEPGDVGDQDVGEQDSGGQDVGDDDAGNGEPVDELLGCHFNEPTITFLSSRSAAIGEDGTMHVAVGGDRVRYARNQGDGWQTEIVDAGDAVAMALDGDDEPVLAYFDRSEFTIGGQSAVERLKVARRDENGWEVEVIDVVERREMENGVPDLTITDDGQIYVAYRLDIPARLKVAHFDGDDWSTATSFVVHHGTRWVFADTSPTGQPTAVQISNPSQFLNRNRAALATRSAQGWSDPVEHETENHRWLHDFFVDGQGRPSLVGSSSSSAWQDSLDIYTWQSGDWNLTTCEFDRDNRALRVSATTDELGRPWTISQTLAYADEVGPDPASIAIHRIGADCAAFEPALGRTLYSREGRSYHEESMVLYDIEALSLAVRGDAMLVAYFDQADGVMRAAWSDDAGQSFIIDELWTTGVHGYAQSMVRRDDGTVDAVYADPITRQLWWAHFDGSQWSQESIVEEPGCMPRVTELGSMDLVSDEDGVALAYLRQCQGPIDIVIARQQSNGEWVRDVVDNSSFTHVALRLVRRPDGALAMAYIKGNDLHYGFDTGLTWNTESLSSSAPNDSYPGSTPALAHDQQSRPLLAWHERQSSNNHEVRLARLDPVTGWEQEVVEAGIRGSGPVDLMRDDDGRLHLVYSHRSDRLANKPGELRYATRATGEEWALDVIDDELQPSRNFFQWGGATVLHDGEHPVVVYHQGLRDKLVIARKREGVWWTDIVDEPGQYGWHPTARWTDDGTVLASSHNRTDGTLCFDELELP